jgi:NAD(P)-dependent dehydrogenase (short-subunit alcohol dehydrogenase family)
MRLKDKTAIITGGNSGIGLATARLFVSEGAKVVITGRNEQTLVAAAEELGPNALTFRADVRDDEARKKLFAMVHEKLGHLDIVFANAGDAKIASIAETGREAFDGTLTTNVTGAFLTVQGALPLLGPGASVVLCGSVAGVVGWPAGGSSYAASKAALSGLCRSLAGELSPRGIRVNVVEPGFTLTPPFLKAPQALRDKFQTHIPLNRWAEPEEIAKAVLFLASDDSSYVNCADLVVDAGLSGGLFAAPLWRQS